MKSYILEAHRGVGTEFPEETMSAFRAAIGQGYGMIELDTKFTADDRCVLLHDGTVNRTGRKADGTPVAEKTPIGQLTLAEAEALDFGIWFAPSFAGEKIPTLEEVLHLAMEAKIPLKFDNVLWGETSARRQIFFDTIVKMGAEAVTEITCSRVEQIQETLTYLPQAQIHYDGPATEEALAQVGAIVPSTQLTTWVRMDNEHTHWCANPAITEEIAAMVHRYGKLGIWLLSKEEDRTQALERFGADVIETNGKLKP